MSRFLEEFAAQAQALGAPVFRVAEILGENEPEFREILPANPCQDSYSMAKAFVVTGIGMLCDRGLLSVDERVTEILQEHVPQGMDGRWNKMTVEHALLHRCALPKNYLDIDLQNIYEYGTDDFLQYLLSTPLTGTPGEEECYTDAAFYLLSRVFTQKCGEKLDDFLWRELFYPLGVREAGWSRCPHGYPMGATGLFMRAEDVARLGAVYMNGGSYRHRRYLSEDWVRQTLARGYELRALCGGAAYGKGGMRGQQLMVIPAQRRVVAWHAFGAYDKQALIAWAAQWRE